jgi:hypothetical protein
LSYVVGIKQQIASCAQWRDFRRLEVASQSDDDDLVFSAKIDSCSPSCHFVDLQSQAIIKTAAMTMIQKAALIRPASPACR